MNRTLSVFLLATLLVASNAGILDRAPVVAYVDNINNWWGCDVPADLGLPSGYTDGPNVIVLSFWTTSQGAADATALWSNLPQYIPDNCGYGSSNSEMQQNLINTYHSRGIKVIGAAFGATDFPTSRDPTQTCTDLAHWILDNKLDGVDLDYEDSDAFSSGVGARWLITCTRVLRQYLPKGQYILTHAPQGPYFTITGMYADGAYQTVDREVGSLIDWYNLQYYNQGTYTTYDECFGSSSNFPGTAVLELKNLNSKVVVGKPATAKDAGDGWVSKETLASWLQQANRESGWCGGAMFWEFASDSDKSFARTMRNAVDSFSGCSGRF